MLIMISDLGSVHHQPFSLTTKNMRSVSGFSCQGGGYCTQVSFQTMLRKKAVSDGRSIGKVSRPIDLHLILAKESSLLFLLTPLAHSVACFFRRTSSFLQLFHYSVLCINNLPRRCRTYLVQIAPLGPPMDIINLNHWLMKHHPLCEYRIPFN